jgi:2-polyprenyl-6-methoxyphenol hydroxylase-like FAD-dependent oxidoreductase
VSLSTAMTQLPTGTQVLIAGGGPVGLAAAIELGQRGINCLVIEPRVEISRARPRCKTINVRTMEHLRRWGIADRLRAAAPLSPTWSQDIVFCTTMTGRELSRFTGVFGLNADPELCPEVGQQAPQYILEEVLREVVNELPACTLALGARVVGLEQDDDTVRVSIEIDGASVDIETEYVLGCDGSRSAVRSAIGAQYEGNVALRPSFGFVIRAPDLWNYIPHGRALHYWILNERAPGSFGPLDGKDLWWGGFGVDQERGEREILDLLEAAIGRKVPLEVISTDAWIAHMEIANTSRVGRVFLAGDAGHLNPPWGGHGMNTGVGDAVDVGWKLAAVLQGWGGAALLDSYDVERRPVQLQIIDEAKANMAVLSHDLLTPQIDHDGPDGDEARRRLHERVQETKTREFHSLGLVLGLGFEHSPVVIPRSASRSNEHRHVRPGFRLPHAWLKPGLAVFDRLGPGLTLLTNTHSPVETEAFAIAAQAHGIPFDVVDVGSLSSGLSYDVAWALVRPDQHVAWAGEELPHSIDRVIDTVRGTLGSPLAGTSNPEAAPHSNGRQA